MLKIGSTGRGLAPDACGTAWAERGWGPGGTPGSLRYTDTDLRRLHDHTGQLRPLLLWVGRFLDFKRLPVLLHAFATARARLMSSS